MGVREILDARIIDLNVKANSKDEALRHLSGLLEKAGYIGDVDEFVSDIYARESEGITGIGQHIAIPHGKSHSVTNVGIAIGKLDNHIEWESIDEEPVNIIFLFAVPFDFDYARNHMKLLAELAGKLGRSDTVENLQNIKTLEELQSIFD
ncbi:PTS sugar transporter subunit IIA [Anaerotalea alkaliphila]|uniref:PTS transporter subunit EIIA n=1 Tax=Anaerotalea alkaliphila TaxID=2662126 RepID=A0A7X5HWD0_9FIRM|nr:PTS sugar transporter subunit IIA [Anaerotalea alkaliphila]NDL67855.1 PTS transporter subunit EIIA [Anaerotalea alkaliphila]